MADKDVLRTAATLRKPRDFNYIQSVGHPCCLVRGFTDIAEPQKKFKIIKTDKFEWVEGVDDKNLKFTTKSCSVKARANKIYMSCRMNV